MYVSYVRGTRTENVENENVRGHGGKKFLDGGQRFEEYNFNVRLLIDYFISSRYRLIRVSRVTIVTPLHTAALGRLTTFTIRS